MNRFVYIALKTDWLIISDPLRKEEHLALLFSVTAEQRDLITRWMARAVPGASHHVTPTSLFVCVSSS